MALLKSGELTPRLLADTDVASGQVGLCAEAPPESRKCGRCRKITSAEKQSPLKYSSRIMEERH